MPAGLHGLAGLPHPHDMFDMFGGDDSDFSLGGGRAAMLPPHAPAPYQALGGGGLGRVPACSAGGGRGAGWRTCR